MMPVMDGVKLLRELRADPSTREIPVMLLSARAGEETILEGLDTGADDYLVKPFSARELIARLRTHVQIALIRRKSALELESANRELEAFNYSVSHDLMAPLRAIQGFSTVLLEDYGDKLDENGRSDLKRICTAAQRMKQLIDDLFALARFSRAELHRVRTDLSALALGVVADLRKEEPGRSVEISITPGLVVQADTGLLRAVLENLLRNAWKFTSKQAAARIEFGTGESVEEKRIFFVRDNGAGFDMAYAQNLFAPFQRLHRQSEFAGTGIGLSIVRRIVNRHGGRIWAEGAVNGGATFRFTLEE